MPNPIFPNESTVVQAEDWQTKLIDSVVKLFQQGLAITPETTLSDLAGAEADYDDYAPEVIAAWFNPISSALGGSQLSAPGVQFACTGTQVTPNSIGGYWIETDGGDLVYARQFDDPEPMVNATDGFGVYPTIIVPN